MIEILKCPNCGAPLNPRRSLKCEYCNSQFKTDEPIYVHQAILYADDKPIETYDLDDRYYSGYNLSVTANEVRQRLLMTLAEAELNASQIAQTNEMHNHICQHMSKWH